MRKAIILILVPLLSCVAGCDYIQGSGKVVTEERQVSDFDKVLFGCSGVLNIVQGNKESLTIKADDNIMPYIEAEVRGGRLRINIKDQGRFINIQPSRDIEFNLTLKDICELELVGSGSIRSQSLKSQDMELGISGSGSIEIDELKSDELDFELSGSGSFSIKDIKAEEVSAEITGSGKYSLGGKIYQQDIRITGSGNYNAKKLECKEAVVHISGSGDAEISVSDELEVKISGSGDVDYYGSPKTSIRISGSGDVNQRGR